MRACFDWQAGPSGIFRNDSLDGPYGQPHFFTVLLDIDCTAISDKQWLEMVLARLKVATNPLCGHI